MGEILIRANFCGKTRFVPMDENALDAKIFVEKAAEIFNIQSHGNAYLTDNLNTDISSADFEKVVRQFYKGNFFININLEYDENHPIITTAVLKTYLIDKCGAEFLFTEAKSGTMSDRSRCQLVEYVTKFMHETIKGDIKRVHKIMAARATVALFSNFKTEAGEGYDLFYNPINGGWIGMKLKNSRKKMKKNNIAAEDENNAQDDPLCVDMNEIFFKLKTIDVSKTELAEIKIMLKSTFQYRQNMIKNNENLDLLENFPYFFTNPELVLVDFAEHYSDKNPNAFIDTWTAFGKKLKWVSENEYKFDVRNIEWPENIVSFLTLIKLFPRYPGKTGLASRVVFDKAIKKLIIFSKNNVSPDEMKEKNNNHPYIIAVGESMDNISHYFIEVEKHLMCIPPQYDFIRTLDLFFKVIKVFGLCFEPNLVPAFNFVQYFLYDLREERQARPTNKMFDVFLRCQNAE